jgi:hypothetical protein
MMFDNVKRWVLGTVKQSNRNAIACEDAEVHLSFGLENAEYCRWGLQLTNNMNSGCRKNLKSLNLLSPKGTQGPET